MTTSAPPTRVALAAQPPLLADALRVLLLARGVEVTVGAGKSGENFDVAVVLDPADCERIRARVYAMLDHTPHSTGGAELHAADGRRLGAVSNSDELIAALVVGELAGPTT